MWEQSFWLYLGCGFLTFVISLSLVPVIRRFSTSNLWLSVVDFRRKQNTAIPLLGGLAISLPVIVISSSLSTHLWTYWLTSLPLLIVGALDDIRQLSAKLKLFAQFSSVALWFMVFPVQELSLVQLGVSPYLSIALTGFWILGIMNALNMLDGMDGEASLFSLLVMFFLLSYPITSEHTLVLVSMAAGVSAFLIFNFPPANIYLGDSGSTFLGFVLATNAATLPTTHSWHLLSPLFLLAVPGVDALLAILRRAKARSGLFNGDHDHIHHKLQKIGLSVRWSLFVIALVTVHCGITASLIFYLTSLNQALSVAALTTSGLLGILAAIYFTEYRLANNVSKYSKTMLHDFLDIESVPPIDRTSFTAVVYDLLPYYKELQTKGIAELQSFVRDFTMYLKSTHEDSHFCLFGSYTVVAIRTPRRWAQNEVIVKNFYLLLDKHQVTKNQGDLPWGVHFYSDQTKGDEFIEKFGLGEMTHSRVKLNKTA